MGWTDLMHSIAADLERQIDARRLVSLPRDAHERGFELVAYRSFGTVDQLRVKGRALVPKRILKAAESGTVWRNMLNAYRRLESDEIAGARVRATVGRHAFEGTTDEEGYVEMLLPVSDLDRSVTWHGVELQLLEPAGDVEVRSMARVLVPPEDASFGVISDIDDTIIETGATNLLRMVRTVFLRNAEMRLPFEGVAGFYRALTHRTGAPRNPLFFVSSSPWNFYDFLDELFEIHQIPAGPLLLSDFGLDEEKLLHAKHETHKMREIERVLETYPHLPFILIGDSGQKDPEIYRDVAVAHPGRIRAVYIRDVTMDSRRDEEVRHMARDLEEHGVPTLLMTTTAEAVAHAEKMGWVE